MKRESTEKLKLSLIIIGVVIFLAVAFFVIYKVIPPSGANYSSPNVVFSPSNFTLLPSNVVLSGDSSGWAINNSVSGGYFNYPNENTPPGFAEGYTDLIYYQNPSGNQTKFVISTAYAYNSSAAAADSFVKNKKSLLDRGCVPFGVSLSGVADASGCKVNLPDASSLYLVFFSTRGFFGGVSLGGENLQQSQQSLENETSYYAGIVAANMDRVAFGNQ